MNSLLVFDTPNIDVFVANQCGGKPTREQRPNMVALLNWLKSRSGEEAFSACVFVNIDENNAEALGGWLSFLRSVGYYVYAKPRTEDDTDIDRAMIAFLEKQKYSLKLEEVIVVSNDANNFLAYLESLYLEGINPVILGFEEVATRFIRSEKIEFMDMEDLDPPIFLQPLAGRIRLNRLPPEGKLFAPTTNSGLRIEG
jgi:uncharacterized protein